MASKMGAPVTVWSEERIAMLVRLWADGCHKEDIAKQMQMGIGSVKAAIIRFRSKYPERFPTRRKGRTEKGALHATAAKRGLSVADVRSILLEVLNEEPTLVENLLDDYL